MRPIVLAIAGSDPSAGAGIQADLKAIEANGAYAATAITAITVQSTRGIRAVYPVGAGRVREQIVAVLEDLRVASFKSGLLPDAATVLAVASALRQCPAVPFVLDPLLASTAGFELLDPAGRRALLDELLPLATLITPNAVEAATLSGLPVEDADQAEAAGIRLHERGARAVLVKGGHLARDRATDTLVTADGVRRFSGEWVETSHTHGTGCVYASAIAARLAGGTGLESAVGDGKRFVEAAIRHGLPLGRGSGPTDPLFSLHSGAWTDRPIAEPGA